MKRALVLIGFESEELSSPGLEPMAGPLLAAALAWREHFLARGETVLEGWAGVVEPELTHLVLAGAHLHDQIRTCALEARARGLQVSLAEDACASDDPLHAAITRRFLSERGVGSESLDPADGRQHLSPHNGRVLFRLDPSPPEAVHWAVQEAGRALSPWARLPWSERVARLSALLDAVTEDGPNLVRLLVTDIGKPVMQASGEMQFALGLMRSALAEPNAAPPGARRRPLGVVGLITPFNNPLAIPLGKLVPALLWGNTVVWKPAPPGQRIARRILSLCKRLRLPVKVLEGGPSVATQLARHEGLGAVTLSGGWQAGWALADPALRRFLPFQGELGGNNAAIVWNPVDLAQAARDISEGAFGFAGQRCTANRRVIVAEKLLGRLLAELERATRALVWDRPDRPETRVGPMISLHSARRAQAVVERARQDGACISRPLGESRHFPGAYFPPTLVTEAGAGHEIVQRESFAPVLVVQSASDWQEALDLCNHVPQGLVASLFTREERRWEEFQARAQAGILKRNASTASAEAHLPFGGWKGSGMGPPEHGPGDAEFFGRWQAVYG